MKGKLIISVNGKNILKVMGHQETMEVSVWSFNRYRGSSSTVYLNTICSYSVARFNISSLIGMVLYYFVISLENLSCNNTKVFHYKS